MSGFTTDLDTRLVDEFAGIDQLLAPLVYLSALLGCAITVPAGFRTDFASVPRIIFFYLMFGGKGKRAAALHDFLYSGGLVLRAGVLRALTRAECDAVFKEALAATGYSAFTTWTMYGGVRIGGASHFDGPNVPQEPHVEAQMEAP